MQLNLSKTSISVVEAYTLAVKLGLRLSRKELDVNFIFHSLLNHGSPVGLVYFRISKCHPLTLAVKFYVSSIFLNRISKEDIADLVLRKYQPKEVIIDNDKFNNSATIVKCPKTRASDKPLVAILIRDNKWNVLVPYRCDFCAWSVITGGIEANEQPVKAAVREVYEELGVYIKPQRLFVFTTPKNNLCYVYSALFDSWSSIKNIDKDIQPIFNKVHKNHLKYLKPSSYVLQTIAKMLHR